MIDGDMINRKAKQLDLILAMDYPFDAFAVFFEQNKNLFNNNDDINFCLERCALTSVLFEDRMINAYSLTHLSSIMRYDYAKEHLIPALEQGNLTPGKRAFIYGWMLKRRSSFLLERHCAVLHSFRCSCQRSSEFGMLLEKDLLAEFEIKRLLNGKGFSLTYVKSCLANSSANILCYLLEKYSQKIFSYIPLEELLLFVCEWFLPEKAIKVLRYLDSKYPSCIRQWHNEHGENLLWITLRPSHNNAGLRTELIHSGCDPDEKNNLGLSFNLVMENSPDKWESGLGVCAEN